VGRFAYAALTGGLLFHCLLPNCFCDFTFGLKGLLSRAVQTGTQTLHAVQLSRMNALTLEDSIPFMGRLVGL